MEGYLKRQASVPDQTAFRWKPRNKLEAVWILALVAAMILVGALHVHARTAVIVIACYGLFVVTYYRGWDAFLWKVNVFDVGVLLLLTVGGWWLLIPWGLLVVQLVRERTSPECIRPLAIRTNVWFTFAKRPYHRRLPRTCACCNHDGGVVYGVLYTLGSYMILSPPWTTRWNAPGFQSGAAIRWVREGANDADIAPRGTSSQAEPPKGRHTMLEQACFLCTECGGLMAASRVSK